VALPLRSFTAVFGKKGAPLLESLTKEGASPRVLGKFGEFLDSKIVSYTPEQIKQEDFVKSFTVRKLKEDIAFAHSAQREQFLGEKLADHLSELKEGQDFFDHAGGFFQERLKTTTASLEEHHRAFISSFYKDMQDGIGQEAVTIFNDFMQNTKKASQKHGISEYEIFSALLNPNALGKDQVTSKTPILQKIGLLWKEYDEAHIQQIQDISLIEGRKDHLVSLTPSSFAMKSIGQEGFADILLEHTELTAKEAASYSKFYFDGLDNVKSKRITYDFSSRNLRFNSDQDMYEFFRKVSGVEEDGPGLLTHILYNKERNLQKAYIYKEFGNDPEATIDKVFSRIQMGESPEVVKELAERKKRVIKTLELALGKDYTEYSTLKYYAEAVDKFTSATLGAVKSILRNAFIDFSAHPTIFKEALFSEQTAGRFMLDRVVRPFQAMFQNLRGKLGNKEFEQMRAELDEILHLFNFASTNNAQFQGMGFKMENFFGYNLEPLSDRVAQTGYNLNLYMGKFNELLQRVSGNLFHYDSVTAMNLFTNSAGFTNVLKRSVNYEGFLDALGNKGRDYLDAVFDIGESEFLALKTIKPSVVKTTSLSKSLGFERDLSIIVPADIRFMSDEVAEKYKRTGETVSEFKKRLEISYHALLSNQRHLSQTVLTRANRLTPRGINKGTMIDLLLRPFSKFWDISQAQFDGLRTGMAIAQHGNPFDIGLVKGATDAALRKRWAKAFAFYGSMGVMTVWLKDILALREPRDIDLANFLTITANAGVLGVPGSLIGQSSFKTSGGFYGNSPLGSLIHSVQTAGRNPYKFSKFLKDFSGFGRLWYSQGISDYFLRQAFLDSSDLANLDRWYTEELGSSLFFEGGRE